MKLLVKHFLYLSLVLSVVSACSSSNNKARSRFYAPNRTPTVSDEFRSDADLEQAINQSFKKSQKSRNNLEEGQAWDANKQVAVTKQKVKTQQKTATVAGTKKSDWQYVENPQQAQNNNRQPVVYSASTKAPNASKGRGSYVAPQQVQTQQQAPSTQTKTYTPVVGQYYIQAGCYSREEVALSQAAKLKANGINNVHIINEGGISKVRVGPYENKESGVSVLNKMKDQLGFVDSFWKY